MPASQIIIFQTPAHDGSPFRQYGYLLICREGTNKCDLISTNEPQEFSPSLKFTRAEDAKKHLLSMPIHEGLGHHEEEWKHWNV